MRILRDLRLVAVLLALLMLPSNTGAQEPQRHLEQATATEHEEVTGIRTDRLTKSQLKAWRSIMQIVSARDKEGGPLHPKLLGLYQQAASSGHVIFVELSAQSFSFSSLGWCRIQPQAESAQNATVVLRLNLGMIERTRVSERNRRADGFIPFAGLGKKQRYAEVLGHELTHAVRLLLDADYLSLYRERKAKVYRSSPGSQFIDRLTFLIEGPAEAAEKEVWCELKAGQRSKA